ncbi:MAG TPA: rifamycin-inactivating phosphotransferase [Acidimicrobiales bacterium]|nr:rifamycin-inactivating phosphotransferase [Acidimicrobiales bacterium]
MNSFVVALREVDRTQVALVGGKGAQLGELFQIDGIRVPDGFCVTTQAYRRVIFDSPTIEGLLDGLARIGPGDRASIRTLSAEIRRTIEGLSIADEVVDAITGVLDRLDDYAGYAVRSSATTEDLPTTSFAGQHDTYLNAVGPASVLQQVSRCWASLFTERAVSYRMRNGIDHSNVDMAVVVQRLVAAEAAGVLFTADPVTSNRKVASVEGTFGLGEALVAGLVNADVYKVRDREVVATSIATKRVAIVASPAGGTQEWAVGLERQDQPVLSGAQVVRLVDIGRRIEAHAGCPQDIEWCLVEDDFQIVQSRPVTTLFPIPEADDGENHVYVSVGHGQMMTDAMKPLGLSVWQLTTRRPMHEAGGRLFVDVTKELASPSSSAALLELMGRSDPLIGDALQKIVDRGDFIHPRPDTRPPGSPAGPPLAPIATDPTIVEELIEANQASVTALRQDVRMKTGGSLLEFIVADLQELRRLLFDPRSYQAIMAGMEATWWLNDQLQEWLGEKNVADILTRSVPHNVTAEMGLSLLDVADVIRPRAEVVSLLCDIDDDEFLDRLAMVDGGLEAALAIRGFLDRYGMRCVGEIDITRPRWSERPSTLVPLILANVKAFQPGEGGRRFERGRQEAARKEEELLQRLRALPDGELKAEETKRMIDRVRTFAGYREYPKYGFICRYFVYKQALLQEAERLVRAGVLRDPEDIYFLTFQELQEVVRTNVVDDELIRRRKDAFASYQALRPPRVLTSDGEVVSGIYRRDDVPAGALVGLAVSAGTVEGTARVVLDMAEAELEPGDVLVTACTDPSWSPAFLTITALVTEVGGLMTHGAVIAREYGLPAVVGVQDATMLIRDGQRVRVHGTDGYVELLPETSGHRDDP